MYVFEQIRCGRCPRSRPMRMRCDPEAVVVVVEGQHRGATGVRQDRRRRRARRPSGRDRRPCALIAPEPRTRSSTPRRAGRPGRPRHPGRSCRPGPAGRGTGRGAPSASVEPVTRSMTQAEQVVVRVRVRPALARRGTTARGGVSSSSSAVHPWSGSSSSPRRVVSLNRSASPLVWSSSWATVIRRLIERSSGRWRPHGVVEVEPALRRRAGGRWRRRRSSSRCR